METNKIVKNALKNGIHIVAIISISIVGLQLNLNKKDKILDIEEVSQNISQEEKVAEKTLNTEERRNIAGQITSRYSTSRQRKTNIPEETIEEQFIRIEDITISRDMDLTIRTGISKEDFKTLISNVKYDTSKFFYDNSDLIYDLCQEYQINEIFFCGLISAESGWNIANNHRRTHNYISLMTRNGLIQYSSVEEGLTVAAKSLHNNYLTESGRFYHGKTLYGVKTKFCPASSTWVELVYGRMQQIIKSR